MFIEALKEAKATQWIGVFRDAAEIICGHVRETMTTSDFQNDIFVKKTLLKVIHEYSEYQDVLENGEFQLVIIVFKLIYCTIY